MILNFADILEIIIFVLELIHKGLPKEEAVDLAARTFRVSATFILEHLR